MFKYALESVSGKTEFCKYFIKCLYTLTKLSQFFISRGKSYISEMENFQMRERKLVFRVFCSRNSGFMLWSNGLFSLLSTVKEEGGGKG